MTIHRPSHVNNLSCDQRHVRNADRLSWSFCARLCFKVPSRLSETLYGCEHSNRLRKSKSSVEKRWHRQKERKTGESQTQSSMTERKAQDGWLEWPIRTVVTRLLWCGIDIGCVANQYVSKKIKIMVIFCNVVIICNEKLGTSRVYAIHPIYNIKNCIHWWNKPDRTY